MKAIEFKEVNVRIGEGQEEYQTLPACVDINDPAKPVVMCFELNNEEQLQVMETGKIWLTVLTFGHLFQPIRMSALKPEGIE